MSKEIDNKFYSHEWELNDDGNYKRVKRVQVSVTFQESFVDDSDFMPNINGVSENLNGSGGTPLYDFNSKEEEYDNRVMVAMRDPSLDVTEVDAIIAHETASMSAQFDAAKEAVNEELENIKSEVSDNTVNNSGTEN